MSSAVPYKRTEPTLADVIVGAPTRAKTWREAVQLYHWLRAHGMQIIPASYPGLYLSDGTPASLYYRFQPSGVAIARMWSIVLHQDQPGGGTAPSRVEVTFPNSDTAVYYPTVFVGRTRAPARLYVEDLTLADKSTEIDSLELAFERKSGGTNVTVESVSCVEVPRAIINETPTDLGVELESIRPGQAIYDIDYRSLGGLTAHAIQTWPRRSLLQQSFPELEVDSASFQGLFQLPHPVLPHKELRADTTYTAKWNVRVRTADGSTGGEVRITSGRNANTDTLTIPTGQTTAAWLTDGDIELDCEDPSAVDGLPGSSDFETVEFAVRRTAGSGVIYVSAVAVWEPDATEGFHLMEDGNYMLQEDGSRMKLEGP